MSGPPRLDLEGSNHAGAYRCDLQGGAMTPCSGASPLPVASLGFLPDGASPRSESTRKTRMYSWCLSGITSESRTYSVDEHQQGLHARQKLPEASHPHPSKPWSFQIGRMAGPGRKGVCELLHAPRVYPTSISCRSMMRGWVMTAAFGPHHHRMRSQASAACRSPADMSDGNFAGVPCFLCRN